jgi:DNA repair photolyase
MDDHNVQEGYMSIGITERGDAGLDFSWQERAKQCDGVILITKHLSPHFIEEAAKVNCIVHATITGHGSTVIEPNVKPWHQSAGLFRQLVKRIGAARVVLRIDPIIPSRWQTAHEIYRALHMNAKNKTRVRISFLDNYPHVKARFTAAGIVPEPYYFHAPLTQRKTIAALFPDAEICGEPGFECSGCISEKDLIILGIQDHNNGTGRYQRPECMCLSLKKELLSHRRQCPNRCLYCYWK